MATKIKGKAQDTINSKVKGKVPQPTQAVPIATYTARDLMRMPRAECDAILEVQARQAVAEYEEQPELTEFTTALARDDFIEY